MRPRTLGSRGLLYACILWPRSKQKNHRVRFTTNGWSDFVGSTTHCACRHSDAVYLRRHPGPASPQRKGLPMPSRRTSPPLRGLFSICCLGKYPLERVSSKKRRYRLLEIGWLPSKLAKACFSPAAYTPAVFSNIWLRVCRMTEAAWLPFFTSEIRTRRY